MAKKKTPCYLYNSTDYKYPKGLRVEDEQDRAGKLKSGDYNTGPVDSKDDSKKKEEPPGAKAPYLKNKSVPDLVKIAEGKGIKILDEWKRDDLIKAIEDYKE